MVAKIDARAEQQTLRARRARAGWSGGLGRWQGDISKRVFLFADCYR